jgi:hypothetical protein
MARSKTDNETERGLAVGLVIACALDVRKDNPTELVQGTAGLEKLLTAVERLAKVFGWPDESNGGEDSSKPTKTQH